jgi:hypothetical protein
MSLLSRLAMSAALLTLSAAPALAQDANLPATYGSYTLHNGFEPDPVSTRVQSGGNINAARLGGPCKGFINGPPDVSVTYTAGQYPISIWVNSSVDTTLVINGPDGKWYCDDDSAGNNNPGIRFDHPDSGRYDIWVGNFSSDSAVTTSDVYFSERGQ